MAIACRDDKEWPFFIPSVLPVVKYSQNYIEGSFWEEIWGVMELLVTHGTCPRRQIL